jgi:hypothetical protein
MQTPQPLHPGSPFPPLAPLVSAALPQPHVSAYEAHVVELLTGANLRNCRHLPAKLIPSIPSPSLKGRDHIRDKLAKSSSPQDMLAVCNELRAELAELEREHPELEIVTREGGRADRLRHTCSAPSCTLLIFPPSFTFPWHVLFR